VSRHQESDLDAEIREIFAQSERSLTEHPTLDQLAAYAHGEASEDVADSTRDHLGQCRECTAVVFAMTGAADPLPPEEVAAGVDAVMRQVNQERFQNDGFVSPIARPGNVAALRAQRARVAYALAATLAIACLFLGFFASRLQRDVGELEAALLTLRSASESPVRPPGELARPQTSMPILDLYPSGVVRGESADSGFSLPPDAAMVTLLLTPPSGVTSTAYALRVSDSHGQELWRGTARPNIAGAFVLVLPRSLVAAGVSQVRLYAIEGTQERQIEEYAIRFANR